MMMTKQVFQSANPLIVLPVGTITSITVGSFSSVGPIIVQPLRVIGNVLSLETRSCRVSRIGGSVGRGGAGDNNGGCRGGSHVGSGGGGVAVGGVSGREGGGDSAARSRRGGYGATRRRGRDVAAIGTFQARAGAGGLQVGALGAGAHEGTTVVAGVGGGNENSEDDLRRIERAFY